MAVFGKGASGAVIRSQNCAVDRSMPARNDSSPKVTDSGTIPIPSALAWAGSRSEAESVTNATRATASLLPTPGSPCRR